jgi:hypothetical protein
MSLPSIQSLCSHAGTSRARCRGASNDSADPDEAWADQSDCVVCLGSGGDLRRDPFEARAFWNLTNNQPMTALGRTARTALEDRGTTLRSNHSSAAMWLRKVTLQTTIAPVKSAPNVAIKYRTVDDNARGTGWKSGGNVRYRWHSSSAVSQIRVHVNVDCACE